MNWIIRLGQWWEERRKAKLSYVKEVENALIKRLEQLEKPLPTATTNQIKIMQQRLDQIELYVGLKRDKGPVPVEGAARIG